VTLPPTSDRAQLTGRASARDEAMLLAMLEAEDYALAEGSLLHFVKAA